MKIRTRIKVTHLLKLRNDRIREMFTLFKFRLLYVTHLGRSIDYLSTFVPVYKTKACEKMELQLQAFVTSAVEGGGAIVQLL